MAVLELNDGNQGFPRWKVVPPTIKVSCALIQLNLPSISELHRCPTLKTLRLKSVDWSELQEFLLARKQYVENRLEVDGVRMEPLKKLVIDFELIKEEGRNELRSLVETLVGRLGGRTITLGGRGLRSSCLDL